MCSQIIRSVLRENVKKQDITIKIGYFREVLILGAIDIGSNAARLLIAEVQEQNGLTHYTKLNLLRIPLRLGFRRFRTWAHSQR